MRRSRKAVDVTTREDSNSQSQQPVRPRQTVVYLPGSVHRRLSRYIQEQYDGRLNVRSAVVSKFIDEKLAELGY